VIPHALEHLREVSLPVQDLADYSQWWRGAGPYPSAGHDLERADWRARIGGSLRDPNTGDGDLAGLAKPDPPASGKRGDIPGDRAACHRVPVLPVAKDHHAHEVQRGRTPARLQLGGARRRSSFMCGFAVLGVMQAGQAWTCPRA
jgi:hypothetical protein